MDEYSDPVAIGKAMDASDRLKAMWASRDELAGCLRGAVTAMEGLQCLDRYNDFSNGLPDLIERSKKALLEYDK